MSKDLPNQLKFNDPAPDLELRNVNGKPVLLSDLWKQKPLILAFTRHFGCPQCKEMLWQLGEYQEKIQAAGLQIAVVTQASPQESEEFIQTFARGLFALCDPERKAYDAYGLTRGKLGQTLFSPKVWFENRRVAKTRGFNPQIAPAGQDTMLMSGTFVIGSDGKIRLPYYYDNIADHPKPELLMEGFLSTGWDKPFDSPLGPEKA